MLRPPSSVLGTAPWRRAPLLLRRSPAVLLVVLTSQLVLADEPSAQDAAWVHDVFAALRQVVHDRGAACLVATHDPDALAFADRVLRLADGELTERAP